MAQPPSAAASDASVVIATGTTAAAIPPALTIDECAETLRTHRPRVYDLIAAGKLETFTMGKSRRIVGESVARFIREAAQAPYAPRDMSAATRGRAKARAT